MDELDAVRQLLAQPPPSPDVVGAARASLEQAGLEQGHLASGPGVPPVHLNGGRHLLDLGGPAAPHRRWRWWRGWLAPVAAAAAVVTVVAISVAISGGIQQHRPPVRPPASVPGIHQVPRYFMVLTGGKFAPQAGKRAVVAATATGAVLGSVTPPAPYGMFSEVAAAGDDRTFVLAAQRAVPYASGSPWLTDSGPARLYKLVLSRSGRPGRLTALPVPPVAGSIDGFALSPDGSKLAVSLQPTTRLARSGPAPPPRGARLLVFTLANGAERNWTLPGIGWIGGTKPDPRSLSWADDSRALLFEVHHGTGGPIARLRLLDTTAPSGSLTAASKTVPVPSADISGHVENPPLSLGEPLLLTGDGTKVVAGTEVTTTHPGSARDQRLRRRYLSVLGHLWNALHEDQVHNASRSVIQQANERIKQAAATYRKYQPAFTTVVAVTEVSVRTGKSVRILGQRQVPGIASQWVLWTNPTGTALIIAGPGPRTTQRNQNTVLGIQAGNTFTPLPAGVQSLQGKSPTW
jgi:hypothetical protein